MSLQKLVAEARAEADRDMDQTCHERGLIFKTRKHRWGRWEENGGYSQNGSEITLFYTRECKICGWAEHRRKIVHE